MHAVIHDHDGHIDDLISLGMLASSPHLELLATTLVPADSYLEPATAAVEKLLTLLGKTSVEFANDDDEAPNPFPHEFRKDSDRLPGLGVFSSVKLHQVKVNSVLNAPQLLVKILATQKSEIVATGPLTNLAGALRIDPTIARNISNLYVMGGALRVNGNVYDQEGHDGTAEWNIYNNAVAAQKVLHSGIPITLVSLDITNEFPVTKELFDQAFRQNEFSLAQMACEAWKIILENPAQASSYYMWDMLTAASCLNPSLFDFEFEKISVDTLGPSCGRTRIDPNGTQVRVPILKNRAAVEKFILQCLRF